MKLAEIFSDLLKIMRKYLGSLVFSFNNSCFEFIKFICHFINISNKQAQNEHPYHKIYKKLLLKLSLLILKNVTAFKDLHFATNKASSKLCASFGFDKVHVFLRRPQNLKHDLTFTQFQLLYIRCLCIIHRIRYFELTFFS